MPLLCTWWPVWIVSFMTEAHLSKTVRQSWVQGSRGGAEGTAVCQCPHCCLEKDLGAGVWFCFLHGGRTILLSLRPRCCSQYHRVVSPHLRSHTYLESLRTEAWLEGRSGLLEEAGRLQLRTRNGCVCVSEWWCWGSDTLPLPTSLSPGPGGSWQD